MFKIESPVNITFFFEETGLINYCDVSILEKSIKSKVDKVEDINFFDNSMTLKHTMSRSSEELDIPTVFEEAKEVIQYTIRDVIIPSLEEDIKVEDDERTKDAMIKNLAELEKLLVK